MLLVLMRILLLMKNPPTPLKGGYKPFYTRHNSVLGFNPPLGGQGGKNKGTLHPTSLQIIHNIPSDMSQVFSVLLGDLKIFVIDFNIRSRFFFDGTSPYLISTLFTRYS